MTAPLDIETGARTRILDAAANAFMERGFAATTIDDIAEAVGATKGLVYYHFRAKFDIFLAVYEEGMRRVRDDVEPLSKGPRSAYARLELMSVAHVENVMAHLRYHIVIHQGVREHSSAALRAHQRDALTALNELRADYEAMFRRVVNDGITEGSLRPLDAALTTRTLLSSLNAVDTWYRPVVDQGRGDLHTLAVKVVDILIGGLSAPTRTTMQG